MYTNILIPTDGSALAGKAVQHGIALAKRITAKVTVLTVLPPFHTLTIDTQMIEDTPAQYKARMHEHAKKTLGAVASAAQAANVSRETVQIEDEHPYQAIIDTATSKGCSTTSVRYECSCNAQCPADREFRVALATLPGDGGRRVQMCRMDA